jgi:Ruegeria phage exonuclease
MLDARAKSSPSSAYRWLVCPGNILLSTAGGSDGDGGGSSFCAAEGTGSHTVREYCLSLGLEPVDFLGDVMQIDGFEITITEVAVKALTAGIERIRLRPGNKYFEHRVTLKRWRPDCRGTLGCGIVGRDVIEIDDLKYGAGTPVSPGGTEQLLTCALGFWGYIARHVSNATDFLLVIDQPRAAGGGGKWECSLDELLEHGERLAKADARIEAMSSSLEDAFVLRKLITSTQARDLMSGDPAWQ